jgi:hypothetical protein
MQQTREEEQELEGKDVGWKEEEKNLPFLYPLPFV